jgi:hypothetical protein
MNLIRIITWLLVIWTLWFLVKNYLKKQNQQQDKPPSKKQIMVQCQLCQVHLPDTDAVLYDSRWFCDRAHLQIYLQKKSKN